MHEIHVPQLRTLLKEDESMYTRVYVFTFKMARASPASTSLPRETAIEYWKILFPIFLDGSVVWGRGSRGPALLDSLIAFLRQDGHSNRWISKDVWDCMFYFVHLERTFPGLEPEAYDVDGSPSLPPFTVPPS